MAVRTEAVESEKPGKSPNSTTYGLRDSGLNSFLTSPSLSLLMWKMGEQNLPHYKGLLWRLNKVICKVLSIGLAHSTYSIKWQFLFSPLINPVDVFIPQKGNLRTLTTCPKFEWTIKKKISPLVSISIEVLGEIH